MNRTKRRPGWQIRVAARVALVGLIAGASCTDKRHDCAWLASCPMDDGGGSAAGSAGESSAVAGSSAKPCHGECSGATPACDTVNNTCHECMVRSDCSDATPLCDPSTRTCVACLKNDDCKTAEASRCDTLSHSCVACNSNNVCTHITDKGVCLLGPAGQPGVCVECTGTFASACGSANAVPLVCDSLKHVCTTLTAQSSGLCQSCVSDAQCKPGQLCYLQTFDDQPVGYFCFDKQNDVDNLTPVDCTLPPNRLYTKPLANAQSIDGQTATLCLLRATTCKALVRFSVMDCAPTGTPNDALCGFAPGIDSKCALYGAGQYRCTTSCSNNSDCKSGSTCDIAVNPSVCTL